MTSLERLTYRPLFWVAYAALAIVAVIVATRLFPLALPFLNIEITLGRAEAVAEARELASKLALGPADAQSAARFSQDASTQNYVELEGGGKAAFTELATGDVYSPYAWEVRLFTPGTIDEVNIRFRPNGAPVGFARRVAEAYVRDPATKALDAAAAQALAEKRAKEDWHVDFAPYHLLDQSSNTQLNGRVDHRLVYERAGGYGEARVRLRLDVAGDELVGVVPFMFIPESFSRRFQELRSANGVIAASAGIATLVLYGIGGCVLGGLWLLRRHALQPRPALVAGLVVGGLIAASMLANAPAAWFAVDTTESASTFWWKYAGIAALVFAGAGLGLAVVFMVAEGLTRSAFGHQPQLWRLWSRDAAATPEVLGRTLGGYLFVPLELALIAAFYFVTNRWLGWWQPSEVLTDPNILGSAVPALAPISTALQAGFFEECVFRAIPLSLGALIGARFGHRRIGIAVAIVLQALVFGGAHATYPGLPAYSRPLELILPSILWALIFLRYGLLPTILLHAVFDLTLMSMPVFLVDAPGILAQQSLVLFAGATPLLVILWRRWQRGAWAPLPQTLLNAAWQTSPRRRREAVSAGVAVGAGAIAVRLQRALPVLGILGLIAWLAGTPWRFDVPEFPLGRAEAVRLADNELAAHGAKLGPEWRRLSVVRLASDDSRSWAWHQFVWRVAGPAAYRALIGGILAPPMWEVRYARFGGDLVERAEEWRVSIAGNGTVRSFRHILPEERPGERLTQDAAKALAQASLKTRFGAPADALKVVLADEEKRPARVDWDFEFADPKIHVGADGEARYLVSIAGDEVVAAGRYVHVPQTWLRTERERENRAAPAKLATGIVFLIFVVAALTLGIVGWSRHRSDTYAAKWLFAAAVAIACVSLVNTWPSTAMRFVTTTPYLTQSALAVAQSLGTALLGGLLIAILGSVGIWYARHTAAVPAPRSFPPWSQGVAAALLVSGLEALVGVGIPKAAPTWPTLAGASAWSSLLTGIGDGLGLVTSVAVTLFLLYVLSRITAGWTRRVWLAVVLVVLLRVSETIAVGKGDTDAVLLPACADGLLDAAIIYMLLRFDARVVPAYVATEMLLQGVVHAFERGTASAFGTLALTAVVMIAIAAAITRYIGRAGAPELGEGTTIAPTIAPSPKME